MESDQFVYLVHLFSRCDQKTNWSSARCFYTHLRWTLQELDQANMQKMRLNLKKKKNENETDPELKSYLATMHYRLARTIKILMHKSRLRHWMMAVMLHFHTEREKNWKRNGRCKWTVQQKRMKTVNLRLILATNLSKSKNNILVENMSHPSQKKNKKRKFRETCTTKKLWKLSH